MRASSSTTDESVAGGPFRGSLSGSGYNNPAPLGLRMPAFHRQQRLGFRGLHSARGHDDGRGHGCRCGLSTLSALVVLTPHLALPKTKISLCRSSVLRTCFAGTCFAGTCSAGTCFAVTCFADLPGLLCRLSADRLALLGRALQLAWLAVLFSSSYSQKKLKSTWWSLLLWT